MSIERVIKNERNALYEGDFALWLEEQRLALMNADEARIDYNNLAEEVADLGKNLKREVASRLEVLIAHLIKLSVSQNDRPRAGWRATVREQRRQLEKVFADSPSLRRFAEEIFPNALSVARSDAYAALVDFDPGKAQDFEAAIASGWDHIEIEAVLDHGAFMDIAPKG